MTTTPIYGTTDWAAAQSSPWLAHNAAMRVHEAVIRASVLDRDLTAPPGACVDGACYLIAAPATGAWAGHEGKMAVAVGANAANGWIFVAVATEGQLLYVEDEAARIQRIGGVWVAASLSAGGGSGVGLKQLSIPAGALKIRTTAGAAAGSVETATNKHMIDSLDFDHATQEHAQFALVLPQGWNAGTLAFVFVWTTTGTTGNVIWGAQGVCRADGDALDVAFGDPVEVTDACQGADKSHRTATTGAMTLAGTPAKGERVALQFYRKAADAGDTLAADAKLLEVIVFFTTDAATDV